MSKLYIIDRFEGGFAVVEYGGEMLNIRREDLPENAKSGDVLTRRDGRFAIDESGTAARRDEIRRLQDELFE